MHQLLLIAIAFIGIAICLFKALKSFKHGNDKFSEKVAYRMAIKGFAWSVLALIIAARVLYVVETQF